MCCFTNGLDIQQQRDIEEAYDGIYERYMTDEAPGRLPSDKPVYVIEEVPTHCAVLYIARDSKYKIGSCEARFRPITEIARTYTMTKEETVEVARKSSQVFSEITDDNIQQVVNWLKAYK